MNLNKKFETTALLVIDVQNDFCSSRGKIAKSGRNVEKIQSSVAKLQKLLAITRKKGVKIIFAKVVYDPAKIPASNLQRMKVKKTEGLCSPNSWGADFYKIKPRKTEKIITKNFYNAFYKTELEQWLLKNNIETIIVTGVTTHICPLLTCADAYYRGFNIIAVSDCLGTYSSQRFALKYMKEQFAAQITTSAKIIKHFKRT
ncbi:MAG: cysteine hydrolase [Candidatus Micrarchaeota archaeon]